MKTDYKNLTFFDATLVGVIVAGFMIMGVILFACLTPASQTDIKTAFEIFDIHEQTKSTVASAVDTATFAFDIPNEFFEQFYIAFAQVASLPADDLDLTARVASDLSSHLAFAFQAISDQVVEGYQRQSGVNLAQSPELIFPHDGKVMGAMIDISDSLSTMTWDDIILLPESPERQNLKINYEYKSPSWEQFQSLLPAIKK